MHNMHIDLYAGKISTINIMFIVLILPAYKRLPPFAADV